MLAFALRNMGRYPMYLLKNIMQGEGAWVSPR